MLDLAEYDLWGTGGLSSSFNWFGVSDMIQLIFCARETVLQIRFKLFYTGRRHGLRGRWSYNLNVADNIELVLNNPTVVVRYVRSHSSLLETVFIFGRSTRFVIPTS